MAGRTRAAGSWSRSRRVGVSRQARARRPRFSRMRAITASVRWRKSVSRGRKKCPRPYMAGSSPHRGRQTRCMSAWGIGRRMPAPSAVSGPQPPPPRWAMRLKETRALSTTAREGQASRQATKPTPQASCSRRGSYRDGGGDAFARRLWSDSGSPEFPGPEEASRDCVVMPEVVGMGISSCVPPRCEWPGNAFAHSGGDCEGAGSKGAAIRAEPPFDCEESDRARRRGVTARRGGRYQLSERLFDSGIGTEIPS